MSAKCEFYRRAPDVGDYVDFHCNTCLFSAITPCGKEGICIVQDISPCDDCDEDEICGLRALYGGCE